MALEEGVFQTQCRSPHVGAPLLEAQLCLRWLTRHQCCLGHLHISFDKHFVSPDSFGMPLASSQGASGRGLMDVGIFACLHTQMQMASPVSPLDSVFSHTPELGFTIVPERTVVGAAPRPPP